jgi:hypothetical protein
MLWQSKAVAGEPMRLSSTAFATMLFFTALYGQQVDSRHHFMPKALVKHQAGSATVIANDPRPLFQAITAVREEYGWAVNYEDPPYFRKYDLVDDTDPQWRAAHPGSKGVTIPAGGFFQSSYPEGQIIYTASGEEEVLRKIVSDCNRTNNPGKFRVLRNGNGSFSVIGISSRNANGNLQNVIPILETRISLPNSKRSGAQTVNLILIVLSARLGKTVVLGTMAVNLMMQAQIEIGGDNVSARSLLVQMLDAVSAWFFQATGHALQLLYDVNYDGDDNCYSLGIFGAERPNHVPIVPIVPGPR